MDPRQFILNFKNKNMKLNSLIAYTSIEHQRSVIPLTPTKSAINPKYTNGLHMCNSLYLYTNPPPVGQGTPAPKTAETVNRAYEYNRKKTMKTVNIGKWEIEDTTIHEMADFPITQVAGNYVPRIVRQMAEVYYYKNEEQISTSISKTYDWLKCTRADEMSKGRQTWDPESEKSITCAKAFSRTMEIIGNNLHTQPTTMLELIMNYIDLMGLDSLIINKRLVVQKKTHKYDQIRKTRYLKTKKMITIRKGKIIGNNEVMGYLLDYSRSFCSYIKHKERGKKDRRAIASGNVILRTFLKIIEYFHLDLSKKVEGNTIGIGGDQKKAKIITELKTGTSLDGFAERVCIQGTEDATKWNECLTPSMFALVHEVFFKKTLNYDPCTAHLNEAKDLLIKISQFTFFLMSIKRIHLGPGVLISNDKYYNRKDWSEYTMDELNNFTQEWFKKVHLTGKNYINSSPGFLMGMLNAASTTIGLLPSNFIQLEGCKVKTLRSSDDSMTVYVGESSRTLLFGLYQNYTYCKLIGINMSTKKTIFFPEGYGEYTSWYQDKDFIGQSGTETSSIRPGGINPQEDFNNLATQTAVLMRTHIINPMGAIQRMFLGLNDIRRLYRINATESREGLSPGVQFLADGGKDPWNLETLLIDEAAIRLKNCQTEMDYKYFYAVMNPENPFIQPADKQFQYSREHGSIVQTAYDIPQNIFNYVRRSNRTINNETSKLETDLEKAHQRAYQIAITIDPSLLLHVGSKRTMLNTYLESTIRMTSMREETTKREDDLIERAIGRLTGVPPDDDANDVKDNDDNDIFDQM